MSPSRNSVSDCFDVAIVGGGLVGLAATEALAAQGLNCVHLAPPAPPDRRTSALMQPSTEFLRELGLFEAPEELGTALTRIRIIDASNRLVRAPETLFDCAEADLAAFGWNFPNSALAEKLVQLAAARPNLTRLEDVAETIKQTNDGWNVQLSTDLEIAAKLLIGADGKNSLVRRQAGIGVKEHRFGQSALVANLNLVRSLDGESVEFHYPNGPFTLVPAGDKRANLVWIDKESTLQAARQMTPSDLEQLLTTKALGLFGQLKLSSKTFVFPLSSLRANEISAPGVMLVGEAAHAFPPIGAQGLNLGLRDVAALVQATGGADIKSPTWAAVVCEKYARVQQNDVERTGTFVDVLFKSLLSDFLPVQAFRASGLWALKISPALRRRAFQTGMGTQTS